MKYILKESKLKAGDEVTTDLDKKHQLFGLSGKVARVTPDMAVVKFSNGNEYGIQFSRFKGNTIVESKVNVAKLIKAMKAKEKKDGYLLMTDPNGTLVSIDMETLYDEFVGGMDQFDNDVEIDLSKGDYEIAEACKKKKKFKAVETDGSIGDTGVAPNPALTVIKTDDEEKIKAKRTYKVS